VNKIIRNKFKGIDVLVNNAGGSRFGQKGPDLESLKLTFETNVFGLVNFTETV
jgi:NADP-dependent 3-hydroxy acid dehydrogenase YdfG